MRNERLNYLKTFNNWLKLGFYLIQINYSLLNSTNYFMYFFFLFLEFIQWSRMKRISLLDLDFYISRIAIDKFYNFYIDLKQIFRFVIDKISKQGY